MGMKRKRPVQLAESVTETPFLIATRNINLRFVFMFKQEGLSLTCYVIVHVYGFSSFLP